MLAFLLQALCSASLRRVIFTRLQERSRAHCVLISCNYHCACPHRTCQWEEHSMRQVPPSSIQRDIQFNDCEDGYQSGRNFFFEPSSQLMQLQQPNTRRIMLCESSWRHQHLFRLCGVSVRLSVLHYCQFVWLLPPSLPTPTWNSLRPWMRPVPPRACPPIPLCLLHRERYLVLLSTSDITTQELIGPML